MAQNETNVSGDTLFQSGDDLSETNITRTGAKSNQTDYVERGLGFAVDHANDTIDIGSGHVVIEDGTQAYDVFPDQVTGISLPNTSGMNYVYVAIQSGTDDDIYYHIDGDDMPPTDPALKIGTVDTANDTSDDTINRNPDADFDSVSTDKQNITDGAGPWIWAMDPSTGDVFTENFASIQAAINAMPLTGSLDSPTGIVWVPSQGGSSSEAYDEKVMYDHEGGRLFGSGIHAKISSSQSDWTLKLSSNDIELSGMWVDNPGTGDAIQSTLENHIHNVNVDVAGRHGIFLDTRENWVGPDVEIKMAETGSAIATEGQRDKIMGVNVIQYYDTDTIQKGVTLLPASSNTIVSACHIGIDGNAGTERGVQISGDGALLSTIHVEATYRYSGSTGASQAAFYLNGSDNVGRNLTEDGNNDKGLWVAGGSGNDIHGRFPSGITFSDSVSNNYFWGSWTGITETTAGYADLNYFNGVGIESAGSGNSPTASSWVALDYVVNRDDNTVWQLMFDGSTWTQLA